MRANLPHFKSRNLLIAVGVLLFLAAVTITVIGCGWSTPENSVRFGWSNRSDFGRLPALVEKGIGNVNYDSKDYEEQEAALDRKISRIERLYDDAEKAAERSDMKTARECLQRFLEETNEASGSQNYSAFDYPDNVAKRNSAIDRLDAIDSLNQGASIEGIQAYLNARKAFDTGGLSDELLKVVPSHPALSDNVVFLRTAQLYRTESFDEAANAFKTLTTKHPRSEKREAALYLFALSTLKQSVIWTDVLKRSSSEPCEGCDDEKAREAKTSFQSFLRQYPSGRYSNDARGWLAFISLRGGNVATALVNYYRLLSDPTDTSARIEGLCSLRQSRSAASETDMKRVEEEFADEPAVALVFAYHTLYNYAQNDYYNEDETAEEEKKKDTLKRIADFSTRMMKRYPKTKIGGAFALRLAQTYLELNENNRVVILAQQSLQSGVGGDEREQALWVLGVGQHRLKNFKEARKTFSLLINQNQNGRYVQRARELLAMVAEDDGDKAAALDQYLALDYAEDVAYFVDVLMTPEEIAAYIKNHPQSPYADFLNYSLGVRLMREGRFNEARQAYASVHTKQGYDDKYSYIPYQEKNDDVKSPHDINLTEEIPPSWVLRDLKTIDDLEKLESNFVYAKQNFDFEAQAESLYQKASYIYESSNLLFYNPAAWGHTLNGRYINISDFLDESQDYRQPNEARIVFDYMQKHETYARALDIYLDVVNKYPNTKAARDALYTAAICHYRLAEFNNYWRRIYNADMHAGSRLVTYKDVQAAYPNFRWPKGTFGWEPSTRTINGGPAFDPLPKPQPRPTFIRRVYNKATNFGLGVWAWTVEFWENKIKRFLIIVYLFICLFSLLRFSASARRSLRPYISSVLAEKLNDEKETPKSEWSIFPSFIFGQNKMRDRLNEAWQNAHKAFVKLSLDAESRPLLVLNVLTHISLIAVVWFLFWTLYAS